jgi:hypothetical protein
MRAGLKAVLFGGGRSGAVPADADFLYYMDRYQTTNSNPIVPNAASAVSTFSQQLTRQSRRIAVHQGGWCWTTAGAGVGMTVTTHTIAGTVNTTFFTDSLGNTEATELNVTSANGAWALYQLLRVFAGSATYTIACDVLLVSGDGKFKLGNPFGTWSSEKTATSSWQRFTFTGVNAAGYFGIGHTAPTGDTVLRINNFNVYPGSVDLGAETFGGHLRLSISANTSYTYSSGVVTSSGAIGFIQFETPKLPTNFTALWYGKPIKPYTDPNIQGILSQPTGDGFTLGMNTPAAGIGLAYGPDGSSSSVALCPRAATWTTMDTSRFRVYAARWDGTTCTFWIDGVQTFTGVPGSAPNIPTLQDLLFNCLTSHPNNMSYKSLVGGFRAWSDAEIISATAALKTRR